MSSEKRRDPRAGNAGATYLTPNDVTYSSNSSEETHQSETSVIPDLDIFTAPRKNSTTWTAGTISWDELGAWGGSPADEKACGGYVLGRFKGTRRTKSNLLDRCALTLDADDPDATFLDRVHAELDGTAAIIHSTFTSEPGAERYRVIVPLARRATAAEYAATARHLMGRIGQGFDDTCHQPERFMYRPSTKDRKTFHWEPLAGGPLDVVPASETDAQDRSADSAPTPAPVATDVTPYDELDNERKWQADARTQDRLDGGEAGLQAALKLDEGETDDRGRGWERLAADFAYMLHRLALSPWSPLDEESAKKEFHKRLPQEMAEAESGGSPLADKWRSKASGARKDGPLPAPWEEGGNTASTVTPEAEPPAASEDYARRLAAEVDRLRVQQDARRALAQENRAAPDMPAAIPLDELLANDLDEPRWRIDGLWPAGARVNLVAGPKAGKTTTVGNVVRALVDGEDFLGRASRALDAGEKVVIFDTEMTPLQLQDWYRDLGVQHPGKVQVVPLVGRAGGLDFLSDEGTRELVSKYAGAHTYILDPIGPVLSALGLEENSNSDVQRFLSKWDTLVTLMGGQESLITHHAGHNSERARGASAFLGSGSAIWTIASQDPDKADAARYIKAIGRDVNVPETQLRYDPSTRRLHMGTGNRAQHAQEEKIDRLADEISRIVADADRPLSITDIREELRQGGVSFQKGQENTAAVRATARGAVTVTKDGRRKLYGPPRQDELI